MESTWCNPHQSISCSNRLWSHTPDQSTLSRSSPSDNGCSKCSSTGSVSSLYANQTFLLLFKAEYINKYFASIAATDIAFILLVIGHLLSLGPQLGECVDHDAAHNVAEKEFEENKIDEVGGESSCFQFFHWPPDGARDVEVENALIDGVAARFRVFFGSYLESVSLVEDEAEDIDEDEAEESDWEEGVEVEGNGFENIFQILVHHKVVEDVKQEELLVDEGTK